EMRIEKGLAIGTGLGSSAASAVAGAFATAHLCASRGGGMPDEATILAAAIAGEAATSGTRHADNVAPALLGGFTIVERVEPPVVARLEPALAASVVAVTPAIEIETSVARAALPASVPLAAAVCNWANAATLVLGLVRGDRSMVARSCTDAIVEPIRARMIPGCDAVRAAAREAGAFACGVSGSGPTLFALADPPHAEAVRDAMRGAFADAGHDSTATVCPFGAPGARIE
ncbi:MAG: homoserine kinase, partial [Phycisphaerales bacterium]|nr:homoserine kinase [Phycisphaerales bacterium]